jgi:hypothetical protein
MATELPYLPSYKNVEKLFRSIAAAKRPEAFTQKFLSETLGIRGAADRPLIALLKTLGFLDAAGRPATEYDALKNPERAPFAIGHAIRRAYGPLFAANEKANELSPEQLRGLISQVAGTDEGMTKRIAWTLGALLKVASLGRCRLRVMMSAWSRQMKNAPEKRTKTGHLLAGCERNFTITSRSICPAMLAKRHILIFSKRCGRSSGDT